MVELRIHDRLGELFINQPSGTINHVYVDDDYFGTLTAINGFIVLSKTNAVIRLENN